METATHGSTSEGSEGEQKLGLAFPQAGSSTQSFDTMFGPGMYGHQQQQKGSTCSSIYHPPSGSHPTSESQKEAIYERDDSFVRNNNNYIVNNSNTCTNINVADDDGYVSSTTLYHQQAGPSSLGGTVPVAGKESRVVLVEGIDPSTPDSLIQKQFECFGDIQTIFLERKAQGCVVIIYHDIRAARLSMHSSGTQWRGRQLACTMLDESEQYHYGLKAPTARLYLVSLDGGRSLDDVYYLLSSYGELKALKKDPLKPHSCCFAEFFDSRHAAAAFTDLKSVPGLAETMLVLDASMKDISGFDDMSSLPYQSSYQTSLSDMTKNLSEISLEYDTTATPGGSGAGGGNGSQQQYQGLSAPLLGQGRNGSSDMLSGRSNASFGSRQDATMIWRNNSIPYVGESSSTLLAGSPPSAGSPQWLSSNDVLAALQAQQRAALQLQAQNSAMQAALHKSMMNVGDSMYHRHAIPRAQMARRNQSDPGLGGRLARNKMNPVAEAERKAHQDRMYGLNMNNILMGEDKRTTLMIKNIPNKYTQKMLLALLEERFAGTHPFPFDFFYLPIDFKNKCNVGYAFINMTTPLAIPALVEEFHGRRWPKFNSEKVCQISYGRIQGKLSLIQHFQNSSLLHEDKRCRPVLFNVHGDVEQFPIGPAALANYSLKSHAAEMAKNESSSSL